MSWHLGPLAPFDIESTGTDVENDRVVSVTVARITPGQETLVRSHLIAVDVDIPEQATEIHGITTEHARENGKPPVEVLNAVAADLTDAVSSGVPIVGSNLAYDLTILDRELRRHGLPTVEDRLARPIAPVLDVLVIDKAIDRYRKGSRRLDALCEHYGVRLDGAHDSTNDALAAARVLYRIGQRAARATTDPLDIADMYADRRYPEKMAYAFRNLGRMSLADLHAAQVGWYAEQSRSLAQYFRQKANEEEHRGDVATDDGVREQAYADAEGLRRSANEINGAWPMRPFGGAA